MMSDRMNHKNFGILDVEGNQVAAGAGFIYKGFVISMTQIFMNSPDVAVFHNDESNELVSRHDSVQLAIEYVDTIAKKTTR